MANIHSIKLDPLSLDCSMQLKQCHVWEWTINGYQCGDILILREYDFEQKQYLGGNALTEIVEIKNSDTDKYMRVICFEELKPAEFFLSSHYLDDENSPERRTNPIEELSALKEPGAISPLEEIPDISGHEAMLYAQHQQLSSILGRPVLLAQNQRTHSYG